MPEDHFGPEVAAAYDAAAADMSGPEVLGPTVERLAELAGDGPALELAIGTGRVALPLRARGIDVHGIDLSEAMVERLRAKPGGAEVPVTMGDMCSVRAPGRFRLAYLVYNTIGNVMTQDAQVAVFANAAAHLDPGGHFVVEVGVPSLQRLPPGERHRVFEATPDHVGLDEVDVVTQQACSYHWYRVGDRWETFHTPFRYVWPSELDLMARLAGMELVHRWAGWDRSPFTAASESHVSVWRVSGGG